MMMMKSGGLIFLIVLWLSLQRLESKQSTKVKLGKLSPNVDEDGDNNDNDDDDVDDDDDDDDDDGLEQTKGKVSHRIWHFLGWITKQQRKSAEQIWMMMIMTILMMIKIRIKQTKVKFYNAKVITKGEEVFWKCNLSWLQQTIVQPFLWPTKTNFDPNWKLVHLNVFWWADNNYLLK